MSSGLRQIVIELIGDTGKLDADFRSIDKRTSTLTTAFRRMGGVLAGAFTARSLYNGLKNTVTSTQRLIETASGVGFAAENFERLSFAFDAVGVSSSSLRIGILDLQKRLGQKTFDKYYKQAGLDPNKLRAMTPEQQFAATLKALEKLRGDQSKLVGTGGRLFEEQSGKEMARAINRLEMFNRALKEYDRTQNSLGTEAVQQLRELDFQSKALTQHWTKAKRAIAVEALPAITDAIKGLNELGVMPAAARELVGLIRLFNDLGDAIKLVSLDLSKFTGGGVSGQPGSMRSPDGESKPRAPVGQLVSPLGAFGKTLAPNLIRRADFYQNQALGSKTVNQYNNISISDPNISSAVEKGLRKAKDREQRAR